MATKKRLLSPTGLDGNSLTLTNVATPSASSDASTKGYVDTLVPSQTGNTGKYLTTNGTATSWGTIAGGGSVTSITAGTGLSGGVITTSGTIAIDSTVATLTGTQTLTNKTLTSPTFTAPVLGTPASGTLTNCTFPTLNQNTTGSAGSVANTLTISSPLSGTSYNGSSAVSIGIPVATTSANGYLSSTDWTTFNNKGSGTVTSVTGTSPVVSSGGATPAISMPVATTSVSGYLSSTDWTTFNNKTSNTGTVTSVSGAGTVSGITLTGTVTGSGSLTLGGTIATLNQNTTGSSGSVTGLTINNSSSVINPNSVTQNQIGYANSVSLFGETDGGLYSSAYNSTWIHEIFGDFRTGQIAIRGKNSGTFTAWRTVLDSTNYTSYSPTLTGTGASGTWGISITGSAGSVPASGLTGATLASGVTASSLTSVGTLGSLTVSGRISVGDSVAQIYQDGTRLKVRSESTDDVVHFASYGMYLPKVSQTYNLYLAEGLQIGYGTASPYLSYRTGDLIFRSDATERMRLTAGGSLGIGTSTPQAKLSVTGTSGAFNDIGIFQITSGSGASANWKLTFGVNDSGYTWLQSVLPGTSTEPLAINPSGGAVSIGTTTFGYALNVGGTINGTGAITQAGNQVLHAGNYSSYAIARGGDTVDGVILFRSNKGNNVYLSNTNTMQLQAYSSDGGTAAMSFHRAGLYAVNFGLDPDNVLRLGGWSAPANVMQVNMSGDLTMLRYIFATDFNQSGGNSSNPTIGQIWTQNTSDNYCRKSTPAHFKSQMGMYHNNGSSTSNIITISSSTATGGSDGDVWLKY